MKIIITESQYKKIFLSNKYNDTLLFEGILDRITQNIINAFSHTSNSTKALIINAFNKSTIDEVIDEIKTLEKITGKQALALMKLGDNTIINHLLPSAIKGDKELYNTLKAIEVLIDKKSSGIATAVDESKIDNLKDLLLVKGIDEDFIDDALIEYRTINHNLSVTAKKLETNLLKKPTEKWSEEDWLLLRDLRSKNVISEVTFNSLINKVVPGFSELWELLKKYKKLESKESFSKFLKSHSNYLDTKGKLAYKGLQSFDWFAEPLRLMNEGELKKSLWKFLCRNLVIFGIPFGAGLLKFVSVGGIDSGSLLSSFTNWFHSKKKEYFGENKEDVLDFLKDEGSSIFLPNSTTPIQIYGADKEKNDYLSNIDINSFNYNSKTNYITLSENGVTLNGIKYTTFKWSPDNKTLTAVASPTTPKIPTEVEFEKWYKTQPEFTTMDAEDKKSIKFRINEDKSYVVYVPADDKFDETIVGTYVWDGKTYIKK